MIDNFLIDFKTIFFLLNISNFIMLMMLFVYGITTHFDSFLKSYILARLFQLLGIFIIPNIGRYLNDYLRVFPFELGELFYFSGIAIETFCIIFVGKMPEKKTIRIYSLISLIAVLILPFLLIIQRHHQDFNRAILSIYGGGFLLITGSALLFYNNKTKLKKLSGVFFYLMSLSHILIIFDFISRKNSFVFIVPQLKDTIFLLFIFIQIILSTMIYLLLHRETMYIELKNTATTDYLTGIHNRKEFILLSAILLKLMARQNNPITLMMLDLDKFKGINDKYGHLTGDKVIIHFARSVNKIIREQDVFGRYGGEEFIIFLPNTSGNEAGKIAERIRLNIEEGGIEFEKNIKYTVSIGVTYLIPDSITKLEKVIKLADEALYEAKQTGRNKIVINKKIIS